MIFKSLFSLRKSRAAERHDGSDAGMIVFLMMALVFVPIAAAHAAMIWHDQLSALAGPQQLATIVGKFLTVF